MPTAAPRDTRSWSPPGWPGRRRTPLSGWGRRPHRPRSPGRPAPRSSPCTATRGGQGSLGVGALGRAGGPGRRRPPLAGWGRRPHRPRSPGRPAPRSSPCTATSGGQVSRGIGAYAAVDPTPPAGGAVFPAHPLGRAPRPPGSPAPRASPCTATSGGQVSLGIGAYAAVDPTQTAGCAVFPANPAGSTIEYLVVPQSASTTPDDSQGFKLGGNPLAAPAAPGASLAAGPAVTLQFDVRLRLAEREFAAQMPRPLRAPPRISVAATPVDSGNVRTFKVCNTLSCDPRKPSTLSSVTATALKVGTHIAIYAANAAPQPGLSQSDLDNLRAVFDTRLYETDTLAFGSESDIDNNGMVIVLMTTRVNALVTSAACSSTGFVAGYFFGADLITTPPFATGNNSEIFYSIVRDPFGTISCAHSVTAVAQIVPVTFVHEFQHMISFNQHFLVRGSLPEDLWLNEGLSHYAEENGGRTYLPDSTTFCT